MVASIMDLVGAKPTLRGERVTLRPIDARDAAAMHASTLDAESMRLTGTQRSFTLEEVERWCASLPERGDRVDLAITDPTSGAYLGEVVLNEIDEINRRAGFRIALAAERHFGRGYGGEAARLLIVWAFGALELHRIELEVYAFNERAIRVYEKLGFVREGTRREALRQDGVWHDAIQMGLLRREFGG